MKKEDVYALLQEKQPGYLDYVGVPVQPQNETLLPIPETDRLTTRKIDPSMPDRSGKQIFVRERVLEKLTQAADLLASHDPDMMLEVVSGYRPLYIQMQLFETCKSKLRDKYSGDDLLEAAHQYIAVPEVAGHPTGGAVDVQILHKGEPLDFGTKIWEFTEDSMTFSPFVSKAAWNSRQLLRRIMITAGFAPFDGEWWHYSYGDKEWAKYYDKRFALYDPIFDHSEESRWNI